MIRRALEFRMLRLRRHHFDDDEYVQKILELLGEEEKKRKLIKTVRLDILRRWPQGVTIRKAGEDLSRTSEKSYA